MALPTIYWFTKVAEYVARVVPFVSTVLAFFAWSYNIVALAIVGPLSEARLSLEGVAVVNSVAVDWQVYEWIGLVNAVLPLSEGLALLSAYWTFCLSMNLFRWAKSFVPTLSN